jgi:hypothetical protein
MLPSESTKEVCMIKMGSEKDVRVQNKAGTKMKTDTGRRDWK